MDESTPDNVRIPQIVLEEITSRIEALDLATVVSIGTDDQLAIQTSAAMAVTAPSSTTTPPMRSTSNTSLNNSYEVELARLRELVQQKEADLGQLEAKLNESEAQARLQHEQINKSYAAKLDETIKKFNDSQKDKTSMVMKYVEAEKKCIELHRSVEFMQSKFNDQLREKQRGLERLEKMKSELDKLNGENEKKLKELIAQKKDMEKLREQLAMSDVREKAAQLKFKNECELHLSTRRQLEQLQAASVVAAATVTNGETNNPAATTLVNETASVAESTQETTDNKSASAKTTTTTTTTTTTQEKDKTLSRELVALKSQLKDMFEERATLRDRLQCMEQERKLQEISLSKYKETLQGQKQMNKDLLDEILQLRETQETLSK
jgi:hypothetical protein